MKVPDLAHQRGRERLTEGRDVYRVQPSLCLSDTRDLRPQRRHFAQKAFLAVG